MSHAHSSLALNPHDQSAYTINGFVSPAAIEQHLSTSSHPPKVPPHSPLFASNSHIRNNVTLPYHSCMRPTSRRDISVSHICQPTYMPDHYVGHSICTPSEASGATSPTSWIVYIAHPHQASPSHNNSGSPSSDILTRVLRCTYPSTPVSCRRTVV